MVAERAGESRQAVAVSRHVVTGAIAVHALGTGLAAVVSIKPRGANSLAQGSSVSRCTVTGPILWGAGSPVLTAAGDGAVGSPAALGADVVTVDACPACKAAAVPSDRITPICVVTVTTLTAIKAICSIRTRLVTELPLPSRGAEAEAISWPAGRSIAAGTRLVTVETPTSTRTWNRTIHSLPPFFAVAQPIHRGTSAIVLAITDRRAIGSVGSCHAGNGAVVSHEPWGAGAAASDAVAVGPIVAGTGHLAALAVVAHGTRLIAVEPSPASLAAALPRQRMATEGVGSIARASLVAFEAIKPFWTHSFLAVNAFESRVTYAGSVDVVALGPVLAVAGLCALEAIGADGTLLLTPVSYIASCTEAFSCHRVTVSSVVAWTVLAAVNSKGSRRTWLCTHQPHPSSRTGALPGDVVTNSPVLAGAAQLTLGSMAARGTQLLTEHPGVSRRAVALAGLVVTGGPVVALALEVAALAVGARLAELLAAPAAEAVGAHAGARDGVAECFILALAPVAAVGPPVLAVTAT